jgi:hypothetical protein
MFEIMRGLRPKAKAVPPYEAAVIMPTAVDRLDTGTLRAAEANQMQQQTECICICQVSRNFSGGRLMAGKGVISLGALETALDDFHHKKL